MTGLTYRPLILDALNKTNKAILSKYPLELDSDGNLTKISPRSTRLESRTFKLTLGRLARSLNDETAEQFEIIPGKVSKILFESPHSLVKTGVLNIEIELGILELDYDTADSIANTKFIIVSGRHRLVSILTWADLSGIHPDSYLNAEVSVSIRLFKEGVDILNYIMSSNGSRNMVKAEKVGMRLSAVSATDVERVAKLYEEAGITFQDALGACLFIHQKEHKSFQTSNSIPLTSTSLYKIAASYVKKTGVSGKDKNPRKLTEIFEGICAVLPQVASEIELGSESISGSYYVSAVSVSLARSIII
jgi:hypothetical protein